MVSDCPIYRHLRYTYSKNIASIPKSESNICEITPQIIANSYGRVPARELVYREKVKAMWARIARGYGAGAEEVLVQLVRRPHTDASPETRRMVPVIIGLLEEARR